MTIQRYIAREQLYHFFQPIRNITNSSFIGFEVLLRSSVHASPLSLFQEARNANQLFELDTWSIRKAICSFYARSFINVSGYLFINVFPSTIMHPKFPAFIQQLVAERLWNKQQNQIIFEISESECIEQIDLLKTKIAYMKKQGFLIAIDDIGKGYSNFQVLIELEPNFLKLDLYFAKELATSTRKQSLIQLLLTYAKEHQSQIVLEGIENAETMECAKELGISYGQGFYIEKPAPMLINTNKVSI